MDASSNSKSRRLRGLLQYARATRVHRPQFSVRGLLLFVLVCALAIGWCAALVARKNRERDAIAGITKGGGYISFLAYDYEDVSGSSATGPEWLRSLVGREFFRNPKLNDNCFNDIVLLTFNDVSGDGLEKLTAFRSLRVLGICGSSVSDATVGHLLELRHLESLWLSAGRLTDNGLQQLHALAQLKELSLENNNEAGSLPERAIDLTFLKDLSHLRALRLVDFRPTASNWDQLQHSANLQELTLTCRLSDGDMAQLGAITQLRELRLDDCEGVTDAGLAHLAELTHLKSLVISIDRDGISAESIARLRQSLPACRIEDGG